MNTDYLLDLLIEIDKHYRSIFLSHSDGGVYLDSLGSAGLELMAGVIPTLDSPKLLMCPNSPGYHQVRLSLTANEKGLWDVRLEAGDKADDLNISVILGNLKEMYQ